MATFTAVGDNVTVDLSQTANLLISISGTYNMVIAFQKEVASPGSGTWATLFDFIVPNETVSVSYPHPVSTRQRYRLIVTQDTSGTATAEITVNLISSGSGALTSVDWGDIEGTLADQTDLQNELDAKSDTDHTHDLADITDAGALAALDTVGTAETDDDAITKAKLNDDVRASTAEILAGTATDVFANPSGLTYFRGLIKPVDGTAGEGNITNITSSHAGQIIQVDQNLVIDNGFPASSWVQLINVHASTDITITPEASGELNGDTSALTVKADGGRVVVVCFSNAGTAPICDVIGDLVPIDFDGNIVQGTLAGTAAADMTLDDADSGKIIETTGNVTVPTTAGFNVTLVAGGAHTVSNGTVTSAAMASGDIMSLFNDDDGSIHAVLVEAADKVSFS